MSDKFLSISMSILSITIAVFLGIMIYAIIYTICTGDEPDSKLQRIEHLEQRCDSLQQQIDFMEE